MLAVLLAATSLRGFLVHEIRPALRRLTDVGCHLFLPKMDIVDAGMDKIAMANAELQALREEKQFPPVKSLLRCSREKMMDKPIALAGLLEREGCVSIPGVLSMPICDALLDYVNAENAAAKADVTSGRVPFDDRFGGVNCRGLNGQFGNRQDQFLPSSSPEVQRGLREALSALRPLLAEAVTDDGMIHEISSFVADPGSPRQCVHCDTIVLPCPQFPSVSMEPIYTCFIALQDVDDDMGHTQFLPRTHTAAVHEMWNSKGVQGNTPAFVAVHPAVQSNLKKGDVAIFDSRLLHCGMPNKSTKRRVIFYFSVSKQQRWPLPGGLHGSNSIRPEDRYRYQVKDFLS